MHSLRRKEQGGNRKRKRTVTREALAKVDAADDAEDKRREGQEHGGGRHQAEEQPCRVRPAERRRDEHGRPAHKNEGGDDEEAHHAHPVLLAHRNPAL